MNLFQVTKKQPSGGLEIKTATGDIASFETHYSEPLPAPFNGLNVKCSIVAKGGGGTPSTPIPIVGYSDVNFVNTQNESIVDLFSIDGDFRGSVAWNQLFNSAESVKCPVAGSTCSIDHSTGKVTFLINELPSAQNSSWYQPSTHEFAGHVVFMKSKVTSTHSCKYRNRVENATISDANISANTPTILQDVTRVTAYTGTCALGGFVLTDGLTVPETITIEDIVVIDLTAMFGSTIADYIYSLEQATAGSGVDFFRSIYPEDYYAYDSGTTEIVGKETPEATLALGQTIYGGRLYFENGWKCDVTHGYVDLGSLNWVANEYNDCEQYRQNDSLDNVVLPTSNDRTVGIICSDYVEATRNQIYLGQDNAIGVNTEGVLWVSDQRFNMDANAFKAAMNGVIAVYPLATPFTIDISSSDMLDAVVGKNNVFSDCGGDVEVEYLDAV